MGTKSLKTEGGKSHKKEKKRMWLGEATGGQHTYIFLENYLIYTFWDGERGGRQG